MKTMPLYKVSRPDNHTCLVAAPSQNEAALAAGKTWGIDTDMEALQRFSVHYLDSVIIYDNNNPEEDFSDT